MRFRSCQEGEAYIIGIGCEVCPAGTYLTGNVTLTQCLPCPESAICYGGTQMVPQRGYMAIADSTDFERCPNTEACLAGNLTSPLGSCANGYEGTGCTKCSDNFFNTRPFKCQACPTTQESQGYLAAGIIIAIFVIWLLSTTINKGPHGSVNCLHLYLR